MKGKIIMISALVGLILLACTKSENLLPAKTHEGRNTSGYRLNEELIGSNFGGWDDAFTFGDSLVSIIDDERFGSHLTREDYKVLSVYFSHDSLGSFAFSGADYSIKNEYYNSEEVFVLDSGLSNFAEVSYFNYDKKILSGLFELNFKPIYYIFYSDTSLVSDTAASIRIWDGRFDLKAED